MWRCITGQRCTKDWNKFREMTGAKVVMDIDDYWHLPPNHILYHQYHDIAPLIRANLCAADLVTVTNRLWLKGAPAEQQCRGDTQRIALWP